ncbi:MAG: UvrD-helicase domain-containing protein, partial [Muribaculaceae bacterium]|nr:UvrD-helicase domain-containing protein [Muribaculaceae bacterium]
RSYVSEKVHDKKDWNVFRIHEESDFLKVAKNLNKEVFRKNGEEMMKYMESEGDGKGLSKISKFRKKIIESRNEWKDKCIVSQDNLKKFVEENGIETGLSGSKALKKYLSKVQPGEIVPLSEKFCEITEDNMRNQFTKSGFTSVKPNLLELLAKYVREVQQTFGKMNLCDNLQQDVARLGILGQLLHFLDEYRKDNNVLLITDTNELIRRVVNSGVPFVFEHTGTWINSYLIDEFQDTSEMQYDNFRVLLDESVGKGNENLIIGDEKQSIYRFRNSNPDLLRETIEKDYDGQSTIETLGSNWRTFPSVVKFNNELFQLIARDKAQNFPRVESTYRNVEQKAEKNKISGYVRIATSGLMKDSKGEDKAIEADDFRQDVLARLPRLILNLKGRKFRDGDIAILVNTRDEGNMVVECLLEHNAKSEVTERIKVVSGESLLLKNAVSVKIVISVLRYLDSNLQAEEPSDKVQSKAQLRRAIDQRYYMLLRTFEQTLRTCPTRDKGEVLKECLATVLKGPISAEEQEKAIMDYIPDSRTELMTLGNVVDKILKTFVLTEGNQMKGEMVYVLAFQDLVNDFESRGSGTIREFLRFWDAKKAALSVNSGAVADAVNVMTIHKSKGLEFPCVILPFVNWTMIDSRNNELWIEGEEWKKEMSDILPLDDPDISVPPIMLIRKSDTKPLNKFTVRWTREEESSFIDSLNKTYVAFTRPKQELHAFVYRDLKSDSVGSLVCDTLSKMDMSHDEQEGWDVYETGTAEERCEEKSGERQAPGSEENPEQDDLDRIDVTAGNAARVKVRVPNTDEARLTGEHMHALFSRINYATDAERALNYCLSRGYLTQDGVNEWRQRLADIFSDPKTGQWYAAGNEILTERAIVSKKNITTADGKEAPETENRRPDRIIIRPDGTVVIVDYKFGDQEKNTYLKQVRAYAARVKAALGRPVEGYVWYVKKNKIVNALT